MKPHHRKQLPKGIFYLLLEEVDQDNAIEVFVGGDAKQTYTPFFDEKDCLAGVFYSWQNKFVHTRVRLQGYKWPKERIYIDVEKVLKYWKSKIRNIAEDITHQNKVKASFILDPGRDARFLWAKPTWSGSASCTNIDTWAEITLQRIANLKNGTAKTVFDPLCHMAIFGVVIAVIACIDKRADSINYLHEFDNIIGQEADAFFNSGFNYAWNHQVLFKQEITDFPYLDFITEPLVVQVAVPEHLPELLKAKHKVPFWKGLTYVGFKKFKLVARHKFITEWKEFALKTLALFPVHDPVFAEFCSMVKLQPSITLNSSPFLQTSASYLFPTVSPAAPPCMHTLFSSPPLKHYARWQLGELAVDMGWSVNNLMTYYSDTAANRRAVLANYHSYRKKLPPRNRCKIFKQKKLCPYDQHTFHLCASAGNPASPLPDMEDLSPAVFFQHRLKNF